MKIVIPNQEMIDSNVTLVCLKQTGHWQEVCSIYFQVCNICMFEFHVFPFVCHLSLYTEINANASIAVEKPIGFYPFTSCIAGGDISPNDHSADIGKVMYMDGPQGDVNAGLRFTGKSDSNVIIKQISHLDTRYSISILIHVYVEGPGTILNFGGKQGLGLTVLPDGSDFELLFVPRIRGQDVGLTRIDTKIDAHKWVYIAATYDYATGEGALYLDGNKQGNFQLDPKTELQTNEDIELGTISGNSAFIGSVSCLRIFNRALPNNEIRDNKVCPFGKCDIIYSTDY